MDVPFAAELKGTTSRNVNALNGVKFEDSMPENESKDGNFEVDPNGMITEKMLKEEHMLEEKAIQEERELRKKISEEEKKEEEEKCFKRLHLLLSRSSIYAKFMAEKLEKHENLQKKKSTNVNNAKVNSSGKRGTKRKAEEFPVKKKQKTTDANIVSVFKKENMENFKFDESQNENALGVKSSDKIDYLERQPDLLCGGIMRPYQLEGFEWLKTLFENGVNGILADEMGLGKTIQSIAFIAYLVEMGVPGPFFVCGPLSTVPNWIAEFKRFTPDIPVILYHGDKNERSTLRLQIRKKVKVKDTYCSPVVITSYQIALIDAPKLRSIEWKMLVIDEAHRIKNFQCKLVTALKTYNAVHRLLLTGTPLQNNLSELWSLLNFILPEIFDDLKVFQSWFDVSRLSQSGVTKEIVARQQEKQIVSTIHQILTPFLLRRTKCDVELSLPPKREVIVQCPLTTLQQEYYTSVLNNNIRQLLNVKESDRQIDSILDDEKDLSKRTSRRTDFFGIHDEKGILANVAEKTNLPSLSSDCINMSEINLQLKFILMCLRKICLHPYLISYPLTNSQEFLVDEGIVKNSGKLLVLDALLPELKRRGHKVLLFSQLVCMLEVLQDYCTFRNYKYSRLNGSMNLAQRQEELRQFSEDSSTFIFLISTKAGGLGINLTAADTVVLFDSDWNPQGDLQAQDRCHRIGQTKPVVVYRLVVPNTVDEKVVDFATAKRKLEKVIIQKGRFASKDNLSKAQQAITREELLELLESSDVNSFVKTDENCVLSPKELEKLLDRSDMVAKA